MADEAVSPSANATAATPSGDGGAPSSTPSPSSAPASGAAVSPPASAPAKADAPASPTGTKQDVRSGLMDAAKAALAKTRQGQPSAQKGSGAVAAGPPSAAAGNAASPKTEAKPADAASAPKGQDASGSGDAANPDDAEDETKPPPFNEHPRWKKLTRDFETATAQVKELQPDADQYRKITQYMRTFELTPEDVAIAYDITAKMKHNPQLAYQTLKPIWEELCIRCGVTLPDDLTQRVQGGHLDEASARELAAQRAATQTAAHEATRQASEVQRGYATQLHQAVQSAVARWDAQQVSKNPDYVRLRPFVEDAARSIMAREGLAKTPDGATVVLERALKEVTDRLQPFRPPAVNGSTPKQPAAGSPSTGVAAPDPKNLREAMQLGLEGRYRSA